MTTSLLWALHNVVAHPIMGTLELVGDAALALGCGSVAVTMWKAAELVHTSTVPSKP